MDIANNSGVQLGYPGRQQAHPRPTASQPAMPPERRLAKSRSRLMRKTPRPRVRAGSGDRRGGTQTSALVPERPARRPDPFGRACQDIERPPGRPRLRVHRPD
jgi:hypothetical protein